MQSKAVFLGEVDGNIQTKQHQRIVEPVYRLVALQASFAMHVIMQLILIHRLKMIRLKLSVLLPPPL